MLLIVSSDAQMLVILINLTSGLFVFARVLESYIKLLAHYNVIKLSP